MTTNQAIKLAQGVLHERAQAIDGIVGRIARKSEVGLEPYRATAKSYREAADALDALKTEDR